MRNMNQEEWQDQWVHAGDPFSGQSEEADPGGQNDSGSEVEDYTSYGTHSLERTWQVI